MKPIVLGVLGWLLAIVVFANIALIVRPHNQTVMVDISLDRPPVKAPPPRSQPDQTARIQALEARIAEIEANAQSAGGFPRMSLDQHRQWESQADAFQRVYSRLPPAP